MAPLTTQARPRLPHIGTKLPQAWLDAIAVVRAEEGLTNSQVLRFALGDWLADRGVEVPAE